jgi:hypothetical protein
MFITFFYRVSSNPTRCYGKYVATHFSDDHEGLDAEMRSVLVNALNRLREEEDVLREEEVSLGILSVSYGDSFPIYSTEEEIRAFDFYHTTSGYLYECSKTYLNGVLL